MRVMSLRWITVLCLAVGGLSSDLPGNQFETLSYKSIVDRLHDLAANYPHLAQVYSAQDRYELPSPGRCSRDGSVDCEQWVLHISDHETLDAHPERPEVFLSGCLHGDEQVGPTAVMEAAELMIYGAVCHADASAKECDDEVLRASPESVPWLSRLALTRSTVIMPMTNSIGYFNTVRTENGLDPNRDFPYSQKPNQCMTTITARAVNEVWREHAFQLAVTFHGGMVAMAYEWGSPDHPHRKDANGNYQDISPDDAAQVELTAGLSRFAGSFKDGSKNFEAYPTGRMNKLVYPVAGGMEDWAYAGSWGAAMGVCEPTANGGYPKEKTIYNSATLRALNILVEASDNKHPPQSLLGSRQGLLDPTPSKEEHANGHVARNVRLSLMVVDLVEPYVEWLPNPTEQADDKSINSGVVVADEKRGLDLEWTVGGAFEVDTTQLVWGPWPESAESLTPLDWENLADDAAARIEYRSPAQTGTSRWTAQDGGTDEVAAKGRGTVFGARVDLDQASVSAGEGGGNGGHIDVRAGGNAGIDPDHAAFVVAIASVDQAWGARLIKGSPDIGPQSHYVNARTSNDWFQENAGHVVRGRRRWLSPPLKVLTPSASARPSATTASTTTVSAAAVAETKGHEEAPVSGVGTKPPPPPQPLHLAPGDTVIKQPKESEDISQEEEGRREASIWVGGFVAIGLMVAWGLAMCAKGGRSGGSAAAARMCSVFQFRRARGRGRGPDQDPAHQEIGGTTSGYRGKRLDSHSSNTSTSGGDLSRRRGQETSPSLSGGNTSATASGRSGSLERRGLLSPIDETTP
ncbi:unnamed protein product [Scytosiphon promiscuus]